MEQKRKSEFEDQERITSILVKEETLSDKSNSSNEMRFSIAFQGARDVLLKTFTFNINLFKILSIKLID